MLLVSMGISVNFCKIIPYPINRVYIPPVMVWYGIVCIVSKIRSVIRVSFPCCRDVILG